MYNYSPIKTIRVKNFRNIGDVTLSFEDSPIVTLVGANEAGKTSIVKAFATCALHSSPREQKDWIRDSTKMFGVEITLEDGTQVIRVKEEGGINLYRIIYGDGRTWEVSKITDGLPEPVRQVMGLIEEQETGEYLHIRTYEDKLLFVVTPDSTNYKVMYNALKVEQLTKAIRLGSSEVNQLKQEVNRNEDSLDTLREQLRAVKIIDMEALKNVRDSLKYQLDILGKLEKAIGYQKSIEEKEVQLGAVGLIDRFGLQPINEMLAFNLVRTNKTLNDNELVKSSGKVLEQLETVEEIDVNIINKISNIIKRKNELSSKISEAGTLIHIDEIQEINETSLVHLDRVLHLINKLDSLKNGLSAIDTSGVQEITEDNIGIADKLLRVYNGYSSMRVNQDNLDKINNYIVQVHDYLKQCGVAVESCPKCGEAVIFDIDKLEV